MTWVTAILSGTYNRILSWAAIVASVIAAWLYARQSGKNAVRQEQLKSDNAALKQSNEVRNEVSALPADAKRQRLRDKWTR